MKKILLLVLLLVSTGILTHAQQQCAFILAEAQDMYDAGLIEQIPDKLSSCFKSGFTREEKIQAYKLIILSYLFDDNTEEADSYMDRFLHEYPAYEPVATDPIEFIQLKETYDTDPIFNIGPVIGANLSFVSVTEAYSVANINLSSGSYSAGNPGFEAGIMANYKLKGKLNLFGELVFYHSSIDYYEETELSSIVEFFEQQNHLEIPLGLSYELAGRGLVPYFSGGIKPGILLGANADILDVFDYNGVQVAQDREGTYIGISNLRNFFNMWAFIGGGARYKVGTGYFFAELRLNINCFNQTNVDNRYSSGSPDSNPGELQLYLNYVSDDFLLHDFAFSAGYLVSFYNPKKKSIVP